MDHVKVLEPKARPPMQMFVAPGNTEVEVARNAQDLAWVLGGKGVVSTDGMTSAEVGYLPELYEKGQAYFYTRKNPDGSSKTPPREVMIESMDNMVKAGAIPAPGASAAAGGGGEEASAPEAPPAENI